MTSHVRAKRLRVDVQRCFQVAVGIGCFPKEQAERPQQMLDMMGKVARTRLRLAWFDDVMIAGIIGG
jgi:hypothetical protein